MDDLKDTLNKLKDITYSLEKNQLIILTLLDYIPSFAMVIDKNRKIVYANKIAREAGAKIGRFCWETFGQGLSIPDSDKEYITKHGKIPPGGTKCHFCLCDEAIKDGEPKNAPMVVAFDKIWDTYWIPINSSLYLHYGFDITDKIDKDVKKELLGR